jgi:uncharacterized protein (TIGR03083 family)
VTTIAKDPVVDALRAVWASIAALLADLDDADWDSPTTLPGWAVRDVVAHLVGTEAMLAGQPVPDEAAGTERPPHVRNDIGTFNERWVRALRSESPEALLARFEQVTAERAAALEAMSQEDFDAESWTPAGPGTYGRFMQIRVFDCWLHEQDIRDALGRPGHQDGPAAELAVDEVVRAMGFIVGKRAALPAGSTLTLELTGPVRRRVDVAVTDRARVVEALDEPATATVAMTSGLFLRLAGGRVDADAHLGDLTIHGDAALGRRVATNLAFTI